MKRLAVAIVITAACGICWCQEAASQKTETAYFHIGGFHGPSYHVNIRNGRLLYRTGISFDQSNIEWIERPLKENEFKDLVAYLKKIGVAGWKDKYVKKQVRDGTQWNLSVDCPDLKIAIYGSNDYPGQFDDFKNYISKKLLAGASFE